MTCFKVKEEKIELASVIAYKTSQDRASEVLGLDEIDYENAKEANAVKDGSNGGMHDTTSQHTRSHQRKIHTDGEMTR